MPTQPLSPVLSTVPSVPSSHTLVIEAQAQLKGLHVLLLNMDDTAIHSLEPFQLAMLLAPIIDRLDEAECVLAGDQPSEVAA